MTLCQAGMYNLHYTIYGTFSVKYSGMGYNLYHKNNGNKIADGIMVRNCSCEKYKFYAYAAAASIFLHLMQ